MQKNGAEIDESLRNFEELLETTELRDKEKELLVFAIEQQEHIRSTARIQKFRYFHYLPSLVTC